MVLGVVRSMPGHRRSLRRTVMAPLPRVGVSPVRLLGNLLEPQGPLEPRRDQSGRSVQLLQGAPVAVVLSQQVFGSRPRVVRSWRASPWHAVPVRVGPVGLPVWSWSRLLLLQEQQRVLGGTVRPVPRSLLLPPHVAEAVLGVAAVTDLTAATRAFGYLVVVPV